jgi:hypothetical protein
MQTKNYKDFCPTKKTRVVTKKLPTLTKKSLSKLITNVSFVASASD